MIKKIKKLSIVLILFMLVFMLKSTQVFAKTSAEYLEDFKELPNGNTYNLYLGEKMDYLDGNIYYNLEYNEDATVKVDIENTSILKKIDDTNIILAKKVGKSKVTVTIKYGDESVSKYFNVNVKQTSSNKDLDSKINDVVTVVTSAEDKTEVLLKNGELWKIDNKSGKLSKKVSGNVKDYKFSSVYYKEILGNSNNYEIVQKLKNNNNLYVTNGNKETKINDVKQINEYGFLKENGDFYVYTLNNDKFGYKRTMKKVSYLLGTGLCIKNGKTYTMYGVKLFDFEAKQACPYNSSADSGMVLDQKGNIWEYYYTYENETSEEIIYKTNKLKTKVKEILSPIQYKDTSGNVKFIYEQSDTENVYVDTTFLSSTGSNWALNNLGLKENGKVYLNGVYILNNVEKIYTLSYYEIKNKAFIVRKDGSIWKLEIAGKASLTKVRSGKTADKKISKPTNVKAEKSSSKNIKISWTKVDGALKYTVYRATSKNGSYKKIGTTKGGSYTDKKATVGTTYYYKVVANHSNSDYNSAKTSAVKMKIPKTPTSLKVSKKSTTSMKVSYKKSSGVTGYEIKYSTSKDFKDSKTKDLKGTSVTIKDLKKKKTYYVKVRAYQIINGKKVYSSNTKTVKISLK